MDTNARTWPRLVSGWLFGDFYQMPNYQNHLMMIMCRIVEESSFHDVEVSDADLVPVDERVWTQTVETSELRRFFEKVIAEPAFNKVFDLQHSVIPADTCRDALAELSKMVRQVDAAQSALAGWFTELTNCEGRRREWKKRIVDMETEFEDSRWEATIEASDFYVPV
jgi:hypothetical protein